MCGGGVRSMLLSCGNKCMYYGACFFYVCVYGVVVFLGAMYMLAMVMFLKCFVCIFRSCSSVLMVCGILMCVNVVCECCV